MDLIYDIDGTSSPLCNRTCSLLRWLEMPNDRVESGMFNNLSSSKRHGLVMKSGLEGRVTLKDVVGTTCADDGE